MSDPNVKVVDESEESEEYSESEEVSDEAVGLKIKSEWPWLSRCTCKRSCFSWWAMF